MELLRAKTSWITPKVIRIPNSLLLDRWHGARENAATSSDLTWVSMGRLHLLSCFGGMAVAASGTASFSGSAAVVKVCMLPSMFPPASIAPATWGNIALVTNASSGLVQQLVIQVCCTLAWHVFHLPQTDLNLPFCPAPAGGETSSPTVSNSDA